MSGLFFLVSLVFASPKETVWMPNPPNTFGKEIIKIEDDEFVCFHLKSGYGSISCVNKQKPFCIGDSYKPKDSKKDIQTIEVLPFSRKELPK